MYISNPVDGTEAGGYYRLKTICRPDFQKVDAQVHPNILFDNCSLLKKNPSHFEPKVRLSKVAAKRDYVGAVHLTQSAWAHIFSKHTVKETYTIRFIDNRAHTTARTLDKLSVFIHRDILVPVVIATIEYPDKTLMDWNGKTKFYEKLFNTEIGHGEEGCH